MWCAAVKMIDNRARIIPGCTACRSASKPSTSSESNDLRNAGLKVTLPRLKILDILADGSARHMSAEDIYKKLLVLNEDVGLATVYRVLTQFRGRGSGHAPSFRGRHGGV